MKHKSTPSLAHLGSDRSTGLAPFQCNLPKHDLQCAAATCGGAMCGSKLRCACGTRFGSKLRCALVQSILRLAKCNRNIAHYLGNNETNDN